MSKPVDAATTKRTYETPFGTQDLETVECDSCGNECLAENAHTFVAGNAYHTDSLGSSMGRGGVEAVVFKKSKNPSIGVACPLCFEEGPISFPGRVREWALGFGNDDQGDSFWHFLGLAWFYFPIMAFHMVTESDESTPDFATGVGFAVWSLLIWGGSLAAVLWVATP